MISKILLTFLIVAMVASLFSALWFMVKDRGEGTRTVKALTVRVGIWVFLFVLLGIGVYTGLIEPSNTLIPGNQTEQ
ncbi:MAG: twin transmembrane helix small protein [Gammaproteobacteria bacterium]|nr:twin transmembrane helix small protein [Gammaproteobacteria bacterium]